MLTRSTRACQLHGLSDLSAASALLPIIQSAQWLQNETRLESGGGDDSPWGGAGCNMLFEAALEDGSDISASSTAAAKKNYCEGALNTFVVEDRLQNLLGFGATLEEKKSLKRQDDGNSFGSVRTLPKGTTDDNGVVTGARSALLAIAGGALALLML